MIKGVIDFLLSDSKEAKLLRKKGVFKVVPMLNPDGVVYGNYRCSLLGVDLNRRWKHPNMYMHPTIYYTKKMVKILAEEREVAMFCDFHGHSIKKNVFMYACCYKAPNSFRVKENLFIRLLPFALSKNNPFFSFEHSHFRLEKSKQATGRIVNFKENKILASYTLEASFFGCDKSSDLHLSIADLELIGKDLCLQLQLFISQKDFRNKMEELSDYLKTANSRKLKHNPSLIPEKSMEQLDEFIISDNLLKKENASAYRESPADCVFNINEELNRIDETQLRNLYFTEDSSDSGGSESQDSLNDDKRLEFLLGKRKKTKKRFSRVPESIIRSVKDSQNSSFSQVRASCSTPDTSKPLTKARISMRRKVDSVQKKIIPTNILLRSPFIEENDDQMSVSRVHSSITKSTIKECSPIKPLRKFNDLLSSLGLEDYNLNKSLRKFTEKVLRRPY